MVTCYFYQLTMKNWSDLNPYPEDSSQKLELNIGGEPLDLSKTFQTYVSDSGQTRTLWNENYWIPPKDIPMRKTDYYELPPA